MNQRSVLWQLAGFAAVTFGGTILHFLCDWTGGNILVAPFSGVNESTWEHMQLLFWPILAFHDLKYVLDSQHKLFINIIETKPELET